MLRLSVVGTLLGGLFASIHALPVASRPPVPHLISLPGVEARFMAGARVGTTGLISRSLLGAERVALVRVPVAPLPPPDRLTVKPGGRSRELPDTDASALALPDNVISAGNGQQYAVTTGQGPFTAYHQSWAGFQSGIAALFTFPPIMSLSYQGTVFMDSGSAAAYMDDSAGLTGSWAPSGATDCSGDVGAPCRMAAFTTSTGRLVLYEIGQANNCTIEAGIEGDPTQIRSNETKVTKALAGTFTLGMAEAKSACADSVPTAQPTPRPSPRPRPTATAQPTPQPTPVPIRFHVAVTWGKAGSRPDKGHRVRKIRSGRRVQGEIFLNVASAPDGARIAESFVVLFHGRKVAAGGDRQETIRPSTPHRYWTFKFTPHKPGVYVLHARAGIGGTAKGGQASLKVTAKRH